MGKLSQEEQFKAFADEKNRRALEMDWMQRALGIDNQEKAATVLTFRELLSEAVRTRIRGLINEAELNSAMRDIEEEISRAMQTAPEIVHRNTPRERLSMLEAITTGRVTEADIDYFLRSNARDPNKKEDLEYLCDLIDRAMKFFDEHVVGGREPEKIHKNLRKRGDKKTRIHFLFQAAAGQHGRFVVPHACALLRIMAVINFIESDPRLSLIPSVRRRLEELKASHMVKAKLGPNRSTSIYTTGVPGDDGIEVPIFDDRDKTIESMIIKLLHTPGSRAREIVDQIGARFVTRTPEDAIKLIHRMFFHEHAIFPATNIIIPRGKTKINCTAQTIQDAIFAENRDRALEIFENLSQEVIENEDDDNPSSSSKYKAIHIIFDLPITTENGDRLLFPVEFQFTYLQAYKTNTDEAPHAEYKGRQLAAVRARIMDHNLVTAHEEEQQRTKARKNQAKNL